MEKKLYQYTLFAIFLLVISGCSTIMQPKHAPPFLSKKSTGEFGYLVAVSINNDFENPWDRLELENINEVAIYLKNKPVVMQSYYMKNLLPNDSNHSLSMYAGVLPAGQYKLKKLIRYRGYLTTWVEFNDQKTFTVEKGKVVDLGEILVTQKGLHNPVLTSNISTLNSVKEYFINYLPHIYSNFDQFQWQQLSVMPEDIRSKVVDYHSKQQVFIDAIEFDDGGKLHAGSRLGQILTKSPNGVWYSIDTKNISTITGLFRKDDGSYLVGGEMRYLVHISNKGKSWRIDTDILPRGTIDFIHYSDRNGIVVGVSNWKAAIGSSFQETSFYQASDINSPNWKLIVKLSIMKGAKTKVGQYAFFVVGENLTGSKLLKMLDLNSLEWKEINLPLEFNNIIASPTGRLTAQIKRKKYNYGNYFSDDMGETWEPIKSLEDKEGTIIFESENVGYYINNKQLQKTMDGGNSWSLIYDFKQNITHFLCSNNCDVMVVNKSTYSYDKGKSWHFESYK